MTDIYISLDGENFNRLDMDKSEAIVMKYILKDLQDISKVFSPFSQDFTFKATPWNQRLLSFFGDTSVVRTNTDNKYLCKIYTNGVLNLTGKLQIKERNDVNGKPESYTASFGTFMTSLKDVIGKDTLQDLGSAIVEFGAKDIHELLQFTKVTQGDTPITYHIPFMSNNRVWQIDDSDDANTSKDNILYDSNTSIGSDRYINDREVRPAISLPSIINMMRQKYNLNIISPIESRPEVKEAYVLCNASEMRNPEFYIWNFPSAQIYHDGPNGKYTMTANESENWINISINPAAPNLQQFVKFSFTIRNKYGDDFYNNPDTKGRMKIIGYGSANNNVIYEEDFTTTKGIVNFVIPFTDDMFEANNLKFRIWVSFDNFCIHKSTTYSIKYKTTVGPFSSNVLYISGTFTPDPDLRFRYTYSGNTYSTYARRKVDLIKALPKTPVIDFLESYLKTFNIKIFDTSPNDDRLYFITPSDINTTGLAYSKATPDYTEYIDPKSVKKKALTSYNYYNFKHANSKYKSNADYFTATGVNYGQVFFPLEIPSKPLEYKIETKFSIIPPVNVVGVANMLTAYGFTSEKPIFTEDEHFIYTPNFDELTLFYRKQNRTGNAIAVVYYFNNLPIVLYIGNYASPMPVNSQNNSLAFSVLVINNVAYNDSLYARGYDADILRLLNPNTLQHSVKLRLPSNELYLNEATTIQGGGETPTGFRLQNDCIIGENRYSFIDCSIDITTGETNATLLNY